MFNYADSYRKGLRFETEKSISLEELKTNPDKLRIPVNRGFGNTRKIVVSIYIEGWDKRSVNSTMGASFLSNISFKFLQGR